VPPMRRLAIGRTLPTVGALVLVPALVVVSGRSAAGAPKSNGVIRGRVINASTDDAQGGVEVTLMTTTADGTRPHRRRATTDGRGRYRFEGLGTGSDHVYALDAVFQGGLFAGRALTIPAQPSPAPVIDSTLRVWPTTTDETSILFERDDLFVRPFENGLSVIESVTVANSSEHAYIGRRGLLGGRRETAPSLGFALPAGADCRGGACGIVDASIDVPAIVPQDYGFAATAAIPPGRTQITFSYRVDGGAGTFELSRVALYPTVQTSVYAVEPLEIRSDRLKLDGQRRVGRDLYRVWSTAGALDAGDSLPVLAVAEAGSQGSLIAGLGAAGAVIAGGVIVALVRRRRVRSASAPVAAPGPENRDDLLRAIAELDLRYEAGEVPPTDYNVARAELKSKLAAASPERSVPSPR
jgi:hypothetical protein